MRAAIVFLVLTVMGLAFFLYVAPFHLASFAVWAGVVAVLLGVICVIKPLRFAGIPTRLMGSAVLIGGVVVMGSGLLWPAASVRIARPATYLDEVMPQYDFSEYHVERVHAAPERVVAAWRQVTFHDLKVAVTLMHIRALAFGKLPRRSRAASPPILKLLPASGFTIVHDDGRELVFVMAGQPWSGRRGTRLSGLEDFAAFQQSDSVRIAANLRVEDEGGGWSRVITETRTQATDSTARRHMAAYWRIIYPGTGMIRRMWLRAICERAASGQ